MTSPFHSPAGQPAAATSRRWRGFTLIELMIALAVVAILSAIAWPGYASIVHRAQRNDARLALLRVQQLQEMHYARYLRYAAKLGSSGDAQTLVAEDASQNGYYQLSLGTTEDGQGYTATAKANPAGRQARDQACQQLSVDHTGRRRAAGADGMWSDADPQRCWS